MRPSPSSVLRLAVSLCFLFLFFSSISVQAQRDALAAPTPRVTQAVDDANLTTLRGNTHPLALARFDRGAAPASMPLERMLLVLKRSPEQDAALISLLDQQQDKSSPNYHKWLKPEEFGKRFGPADADIQAVTAWLQTHGFQIGEVSKGRSVIEFSGTAAMLQEAFHTEMHRYLVNGDPHWANATDPQIPAALAPVVAGVHTLHDFRKKPHSRMLAQDIAVKYTPGTTPQITASNGQHALVPGDFKKIYNAGPVIANGTSGQGTIAVVGRSNLYGIEGGYNQPGDILNFRALFGVCCGTVYVLVNGPDPGDLGGGEEVEATLDTSWAGAMAPNSNVELVVSASTDTTEGVDLSELYIIDNNLAPVMTESFGRCELGVTAAEASAATALAEQAAAQGITFIASSGDSGSASCDAPDSAAETLGPAVSFPASIPYTVAVGGTMFKENGQDSKYWSASNSSVDFSSALSYIPEIVWNESCSSLTCGTKAALWSGGGGRSILFAKPSWQTGFGASDGARDVPDVSFTAAGHDGYLVCLEGSCIPDFRGFIHFAVVAGTSASAPSFAGAMALVDQQMGGPQGQADYVLYRLAASESFAQCNGSNTTTLPASSCTFNDTTSGNNCVPGETGYPSSCTTYPAGVGYDLATGLGSVNISNLVTNWSAANFNATSTTLAFTPNPTTVTHGAAVTADVSVMGNSGTPTGDISIIPPMRSQVADLCTPLGACSLKAGTGTTGTVSVTTHSLAGGSYNVQAYYAGDGNFAPSLSSPVALTVNPEPSSTTLVVASGFDAGGNPIPFTTGPYGGLMYLQATEKGQSGYGTPTGVIQFTDNGTALNSGEAYPLGQLGSTGMAYTPNGIFTVGVGTRAIVASYPGDASFNPNVSGTKMVKITQATTTTTVTLPDSVPGGTAILATVDTPSRGLAPTGMVTFYSGTTSLGTATLSAAQTPLGVSGSKAQATAFLVSPISENPSLTATYAGDVNYTGSTSLALVASPDFIVSNNAGAGIAVNTRGGVTTLTLTVMSIDSFNGAVALSCSGVPAQSTVQISPSSVNVDVNAGFVNSTLTIRTSSPTAMIFPARPTLQKSWQLALGLFGVAGFVLTLRSGKPRSARLRAMCLIVAVCVIASVGCGGSSSSGGHGGGGGGGNSGTPTGTYKITCQGISGSLAHSSSFQLIVQ